MPGFGGLNQEQVWQVVSFVRSISGAPVVAGEKVSGNAAAGEQLFFGKANCVACHGVNARGGIVGPDLSTAGRLPAVPVATHEEAMIFLERHRLMRRGLGLVDVHLLAAVALGAPARLWTRDRRLAAIGKALKLSS